MPNIGQMVPIEPVATSRPQPAVTTAVARTAPGSQSVCSNCGWTLPSDLLHQEAGDARAGVDGGEDEQRLEHDGEVIPVLHHAVEVQVRA